MCRARPVNEIHEESSDGSLSSESDYELFADEIAIDSVDSKVIMSRVLLNKSIEVNFKVDTGAACNLLPKRIYQQLHRVPLKSASENLMSYGGDKVPLLGRCKLQAKIGQKE